MPEEGRFRLDTDGAHATLSHPIWRDEISGAIVGALVAFSIAVPVGTLTLAPLGVGFSGIGVAAGLISSAIGGGIATMFGSTHALRSGPTTAVSLVINALLAHLVAMPQIVGHAAYGPVLALALASLRVMLAGLLQMAFGWLQLGQAIKFVPRPVVAGFRRCAPLHRCPKCHSCGPGSARAISAVWCCSIFHRLHCPPFRSRSSPRFFR